MHLARKMLWIGCAVLALITAGGVGGTAAQDGNATITVHYRICDRVQPDGNYYATCHDNPNANAYIALTHLATESGPITGISERTTDADGNVTFTLYAGFYGLIGAPGDFLDDSQIFCSRNYAPGESIGYPVGLGTGDAVTCDYYIVPSCNAVDGICGDRSSPPAANTSAETDSGSSSGPSVTTLPNTGVGASDIPKTADGWWLLIGASLALAAIGLRVRRTT